ncbi:protein kinase family protein / WD-40 repeat family protein [Cryptosporidium felis]|nr:protein kinase family protein / WD-40 repeat family protein [Cryptosporidium felis]
MSERKGMLFCLGCISIIPGIKTRLVNSMSFHPPSIKGYKYSKGGKAIMLFDYHRKRYISLNEMIRSLVNVDPARCFIQVKFTSVCSIDLFYFRNPTANVTIIYSHSNATDIGYLFGHLFDLSHKAKVNIICYEYQGYGQSKLKPSEESLYENIKKIVNYAINDLKLPSSSIVLYGQSIGSAPTIHFASTYNHINIGGIIIHSGIKSAISVLCQTSSNSSLPWYDAFKNTEKIKKVKCPVFVIHGTADTTIPLSHGETLYNLAPIKYSPWYVNGANHCNIELNWRTELISKVSEFLDYISPKPKQTLFMQDTHSISRISTLSSQGFEKLCHEIYDSECEEEDFENAEDHCYSDSNEHDYSDRHETRYKDSQIQDNSNHQSGHGYHTPTNVKGTDSFCNNSRSFNLSSKDPESDISSNNRNIVYGVAISGPSYTTSKKSTGIDLKLTPGVYGSGNSGSSGYISKSQNSKLITPSKVGGFRKLYE